MSAPITGQTITFEQISETLRTQYSDAEKKTAGQQQNAS